MLSDEMARGRPKQFDPEHVLDVAVEVFWDHGFDEAGVAEIQRRSGVGRQSLYDTFGDKRALFERALERYTSASEEEWEELLCESPSALAGLRALLERRLACNKDVAGRGCLMVGSINALAGRDSEFADRAAAHLERLRALLERTFERARTAGELPTDLVPAAWAARWLALVMGTATMAKLPDRETTLAAITAAVRAELEHLARTAS